MVALTDNTITYFGRTTFRNQGIPIGIKESDRLYHMYVIGRTGTGKSTLLEGLRPPEKPQETKCRPEPIQTQGGKAWRGGG